MISIKVKGMGKVKLKLDTDLQNLYEEKLIELLEDNKIEALELIEQRVASIEDFIKKFYSGPVKTQETDSHFEVIHQ